MNSTTGKICSVASIGMVTLNDFINRLRSYNILVQHNQ